MTSNSPNRRFTSYRCCGDETDEGQRDERVKSTAKTRPNPTPAARIPLRFILGDVWTVRFARRERTIRFAERERTRKTRLSSQ